MDFFTITLMPFMLLIIGSYLIKIADQRKRENNELKFIAIRAKKRAEEYLGRGGDPEGAYFRGVGMLWTCNSCKCETVSWTVDRCNCGGKLING